MTTVRNGRYQYSLYRDSIHGDIHLSDYELALLDTPEMQRLGWMMQLGFAHFAFRGATHTRLSHAVGTVHSVEMIIRSVETTMGKSVSADLRAAARVLALVHDVAHIPFGHSLEDELALFTPHDRNRPRLERLVFESESLGHLLGATETGREILRHLDAGPSVRSESVLEDLVSGPLGADLLDYLDRDAVMCGLDQRVDTALLRQLALTTRGGAPRLVSQLYDLHGLRADRVVALGDCLRQRYGLYLKVYAHRTKAAATAMLGKAMTNALHPRDNKPPALNEAAIEWSGDAGLLDRLSVSDRAEVAKYGQALRERRLFDLGFRARVVAARDEQVSGAVTHHRRRLATLGLFEPTTRRELESSLASEVGVPEADVILYCPPNAPGAKIVNHLVERDPGGVCEPLVTEHVDAVMADHVALWELLVFVSPNVSALSRARIVGLCEEMTGLRNAMDGTISSAVAGASS